ncbi:MAG TPA: hypothetical protein VMH30_05790, partial [Verrucomicrobiae bacterium]|nr:hypothetical protein [Verrucomicrobiae bacterium]
YSDIVRGKAHTPHQFAVAFITENGAVFVKLRLSEVTQGRELSDFFNNVIVRSKQKKRYVFVLATAKISQGKIMVFIFNAVVPMNSFWDENALSATAVTIAV